MTNDVTPAASYLIYNQYILSLSSTLTPYHPPLTPLLPLTSLESTCVRQLERALRVREEAAREGQLRVGQLRARTSRTQGRRPQARTVIN